MSAVHEESDETTPGGAQYACEGDEPAREADEPPLVREELELREIGGFDALSYGHLERVVCLEFHSLGAFQG